MRLPQPQSIHCVQRRIEVTKRFVVVGRRCEPDVRVSHEELTDSGGNPRLKSMTLHRVPHDAVVGDLIY